MKLYAKTCLLALSLTLAMPIQADNYDDALYELNRGEFKKAIELLEPLANHNYAPALYQMAMIYKNGYGVQKDLELALNYLQKSAKADYNTT